MNITRTISMHPNKGGTFDFILQTKDGYSHAALTTLPETTMKDVQLIMTNALDMICKLINANTDWDKIGK